MTSNKSNADVQEFITHEDVDTKLQKTYLSTTDVIIEDGIKKSKKKTRKRSTTNIFITKDFDLDMTF